MFVIQKQLTDASPQGLSLRLSHGSGFRLYVTYLGRLFHLSAKVPFKSLPQHLLVFILPQSVIILLTVIIALSGALLFDQEYKFCEDGDSVLLMAKWVLG